MSDSPDDPESNALAHVDELERENEELAHEVEEARLAHDEVAAKEAADPLVHELEEQVNALQKEVDDLRTASKKADAPSRQKLPQGLAFALASLVGGIVLFMLALAFLSK